MEKVTTLCMGCMAALEPGGTVCSRCSYDNSIPNPRGALPAGTVFSSGYVAGRVVRRNDLTITYLGLHLEKKVKVYIEEFYPQPLVVREADDCTLGYSEENRIRYKTLYSDMADRWRRLSKLDSKNAMKIRELFYQHNTIYCVSSYLPPLTLEARLDEQGPFSWPEAKAAFMSLFSLVSSLHNQGLAHCGISPENIFVSSRGQLVLTGFALPELRTEGSGLTPELYLGYSAPEQYAKNQWQGEWTDVYALGAVLYKALTGRDPLSALERQKKDTMPEAAAINDQIPDHVSEALVKAMATDKQKRFQSVDEFSAALLREAASNTAVFVHEPAPAPRSSTPPPAKKAVRVALVPLLGVLLAASLLGNLVLGGLLSTAMAPPAEPESLPQEITPEPERMEHRFVGVYIKTIQDNLLLYNNLSFETEYLYNEDYPENIVFAQSVQPGELMPESRTIKLSVSKGSQYIAMPYLIGSSANFASKTLTDLGINFEFIDDFNPESSGIEDTVTASNKGFGARVNRETDQVILTIKRAPKENAAP